MKKNKYEIDMCNGTLMDKLISFAIPLMLSGILQLMFNAVDIIVVGRFSGTVIKTPWPGTSSHRSRAAWRTSRGDRGDTQNSTAFSVASRPRKSSTSVVAVP